MVPFQGWKLQTLAFFTHFDTSLPFIQKLFSNFSLYLHRASHEGYLWTAKRRVGLNYSKGPFSRSEWFSPFSHIYPCYSVVPKCCPIVLHHVASVMPILSWGTKDSWLHVAVPWMSWLKNSIMAFKMLSTSLGSKTLNNTSSLGLGGTKI